MKPLSISIASVAILAAASFGVQAQQQPLPQDNAPAAKQQDKAPAAKPAPSGGAGAGGQAAEPSGNRDAQGAGSDRPKRAETGDKAEQKNAAEKPADGMNKDGKAAEKSGDGMNKDGKAAEKSGDGMNKDGKNAEKSGDGMNKDGKTADKPDGNANKSADQGKSGDKPGKQAHVEIKAEQKTVIKQTFVRENIRPQKLDVQVRVGVRIPRTVVLYALPPTLIEVYPAYRPYKFVMVDEDTILVIDPVDWEIVDVIEV
jgi:Protein of unknown function (DUF1236)